MSTTPTPEPQPLRVDDILVPVEQQTPLVIRLVGVIGKLQQEISDLKDEVHKLKGTTRKPRPSPSKLLKPDKPKPDPKNPGKRPGSAKRRKHLERRVTDTVVLTIPDLPEGARLEGYRDFYVQDLVVQPRVYCYRRAVYRMPDGTLQVASRPDSVTSHFGPELKHYILIQAYQNHVTQGRLLEELRERGIDISNGQLSKILLKDHEALHAEKEELLPTAREISPYVHCDDTSARHQGHSAVCTHFGNEVFAAFYSTDRKTRLNFLRLLSRPEEQYCWCEEAREALQWLGGGEKLQERMAQMPEGTWESRAAWEAQLESWGISSATHRRQVSEAALCGKLLTEPWHEELALISDDAPQFKVCGLVHGLCWVHGERKIDRLIPLTAEHKSAKEKAQGEFWAIYAELKTYGQSPTAAARGSIEKRFDGLCTTTTGYEDLDEALKNLYAKRALFLAVLEHPHLPLHNNLSETDIREYARVRKISGGTRSELGRECRDTFISLKKTCRKLGVNFSSFLRDRLSGAAEIPRLSDLMRQAMSPASAVEADTG